MVPHSTPPPDFHQQQQAARTMGHLQHQDGSSSVQNRLSHGPGDMARMFSSAGAGQPNFNNQVSEGGEGRMRAEKKLHACAKFPSRLKLLQKIKREESGGFANREFSAHSPFLLYFCKTSKRRDERERERERERGILRWDQKDYENLPGS